MDTEVIEQQQPALARNVPLNVYQAINAVTADLAKTGIGKTHKNEQGSGYMFRGIDDIYNTVGPLLAKHGLCVIPRMLKREVSERLSNNGKALFYVSIEAEFDFVSSADLTTHTARTFGEAMDSGDKATNKAMSAAYKYACFQTFSIPLEGNSDGDEVTYQVEHKYEWIKAAVARALELNEKGDEVGAFEEMYEVAMGNDTEAQLYAWGLMRSERKAGSTPQSRLRSSLKRSTERERAIKAMPPAAELVKTEIPVEETTA